MGVFHFLRRCSARGEKIPSSASVGTLEKSSSYIFRSLFPFIASPSTTPAAQHNLLGYPKNPPTRAPRASLAYFTLPNSLISRFCLLSRALCCCDTDAPRTIRTTRMTTIIIGHANENNGICVFNAMHAGFDEDGDDMSKSLRGEEKIGISGQRILGCMKSFLRERERGGGRLRNGKGFCT